MVSSSFLTKWFQIMFWNQLWLVSEDAQGLVAAERIETIIPLTYMIIILMAYYGPNAEIMGTIKLIIWHYKAAIGENIEDFVTSIGLFFCIDFLSFVINGIILGIFCKINVLKVLQKHQSKYWIFMMIVEAYCFVEVTFWLEKYFM